MIFERTIICAIYSPYSLYLRMVVSVQCCAGFRLRARTKNWIPEPQSLTLRARSTTSRHLSGEPRFQEHDCEVHLRYMSCMIL